MKKVLFVATVVKRHIAAFHIPYLKLFKEHGYEVHVCAHNDFEEYEECNIPYCDVFHEIPFERSPLRLNNLRAYRQVKTIIEKHNFDIIHCHTPVGAVVARLASIEARKSGTKVYYTAHGFHFFKGAPPLNWIIYYSVERWLSRYTDVLITINREDYKNARKFDAGKVVYVPGVGIELSKFNNKKTEKQLKRNEIGIPEDAFLLLSVGEISKNKNHKVIIEAMAKLKDEDIHYIICGQGILECDLKRLSQELGVDNNIHFLGFRNDINEICNASDVFVFPSQREGLPLALMEAMASGLAVICSNIRGNVDLVKDGQGGYLVESNDVIGFAKAIRKSKRIKDRMGQFNLSEIQKYDLRKVTKRMARIYGLK